MNPNNPEICSACSAQNELDSNFCEQCAEPLHSNTAGRGEEVENQIAAEKASLPWGLICKLSFLFVAVLAITGALLWHFNPSFKTLIKYGVPKISFKWIEAANYLDAEAITGKAVPHAATLMAVHSVNQIHVLHFFDLKSETPIWVLLANKNPKMTATDIDAVWTSYSQKVLVEKHALPTKHTQANNAIFPENIVVGEKKLKLQSGEVPAQLIRARYLKGGKVNGIRVALKQDGRTYRMGAYLSPTTPMSSEAAFVAFLNEWESTTKLWTPHFSPVQKSFAYTKRGEWLGKFPTRRSDAVSDFQKAVTLDPNNTAAQAHLRALQKK